MAELSLPEEKRISCPPDIKLLELNISWWLSENISEVENGIQFVGFTGESVSNSVFVSSFVEDEEREDRSLVACKEILKLREVLGTKVFVEFAKYIWKDSVWKLDTAKLEDLSARADTAAEFLTSADTPAELIISCGTEAVASSSMEIVAVSLELCSVVKYITKEFFAKRLLSDERDSLRLLDDNLLFGLLAEGGWITGGVEIVTVADLSLALLGTDGEAITNEETREVSPWIADCVTELETVGSLIRFELLAVVAGVPVETLLLTVDKDDIVWVGANVAPDFVLAVL